eukprot:349824-Chlamydomonas_euryale.AAC.17
MSHMVHIEKHANREASASQQDQQLALSQLVVWLAPRSSDPTLLETVTIRHPANVFAGLTSLRPLHPCTVAPLHPCTVAPLHPCTVANTQAASHVRSASHPLMSGRGVYTPLILAPCARGTPAFE